MLIEIARDLINRAALVKPWDPVQPRFGLHLAAFRLGRASTSYRWMIYPGTWRWRSVELRCNSYLNMQGNQTLGSVNDLRRSLGSVCVRLVRPHGSRSLRVCQDPFGHATQIASYDSISSISWRLVNSSIGSFKVRNVGHQQSHKALCTECPHRNRET